MARIQTPKEAIKIARSLVSSYDKEHIIGIYLGAGNDVRAIELISMGTLDSSIIHPRDVFGPAFRAGAVGIVLLHNHPTKDVKPSPPDVRITKLIEKQANFLQLKLLDHIVFCAGEEFYSMKAMGKLGGDKK